MNPYDSYRKVDAATDIDNKPKLLIKVFELLLGKMDTVQVALRRNDFEKKYTELSKITTVIEILIGSLDMECGEIPKNLSAIYQYLLKKVQDIHSSSDTNAVEECKAILATLKEGFVEACNNDRKANGMGNQSGDAPLRRVTGTF